LIVKDFFKPLNPYDIDLDMFKVEREKKKDGTDGIELRDVWFYGLSAKRYCLYHLDGEPRIRKYSSHGLGENLMGLDQEDFWRDILRIHYHPSEEDQVLDKYQSGYAVYNFRVSSYNVYERFKKFNRNKLLSKQVKPFNFITIGIGYQKDPSTNETIKPILPFINEKDKRFKQIPYLHFIDYKTGKTYPNEDSMDTQFYWKPLSEMLKDYIDHPESKSEGEIGILQRKYLLVNESSIHYIGKESNDLDESLTIGVDDTYAEYRDDSVIYQRILCLTEKDAIRLGIALATLYRWKASLRRGKKIKLKKWVVEKLWQMQEHQRRQTHQGI